MLEGLKSELKSTEARIEVITRELCQISASYTLYGGDVQSGLDRRCNELSQEETELRKKVRVIKDKIEEVEEGLA